MSPQLHPGSDTLDELRPAGLKPTLRQTATLILWVAILSAATLAGLEVNVGHPFRA